MRRVRIVAVVAAVVASLVLSAACSSGGGGDEVTADDGDYSTLSGQITIDGSSTVGPIAEAAAEEFGKVSDTNVVVGISGTGGGFERFCRGETDINDASRPIRNPEAQACATDGIEFTEFSIALDGLSVVVNPENTWAQCLTWSQLRSIFDEGSTITSWNQVSSDFPDEPLTLFSPGADSGTFDFFTEEINGALDKTRSDSSVTFSEDDNVLVLGVANNKGAIGYFGYAYYVENQDKLRAVHIDKDQDRNGAPTLEGARGCEAPSKETVLSGRYSLSRPLYMYVANEALERREVRGFINFMLTNTHLVEEVGYIPLVPGIYESNLRKLQAHR